MAHAFGAPAVAHFDELNPAAMQHWAVQLAFEPEIPQHHGDWRWLYSELRQALRLAMFGLGIRDDTSPHSIVRQLSEQPRIRLVDASRELTAAEVQLLQKGLVEL